MEYLVPVIILLLRGLLWGVLVNKVIQHKGYARNWFWWGFLFGLAALAFALLKPQIGRTAVSNGWKTEQNRIQQKMLNQKLLENGGWICSCGRVNANYVTTCPCGVNHQKYE